MMLQSDLQINVARLQPSAVSRAQAEFNGNLVSLLQAGPAWYEVQQNGLGSNREILTGYRLALRNIG